MGINKYNDLIYYKDDIISEYASKRKYLEKEDVDDLLRCALLFLESIIKNSDFSSFEVPNIGFLHKKLDFSNIEKMSRKIQKEDSLIVESAYIDTIYTPIIMRKDMLNSYYPNITKQELQQIQNNK